MWNWKADDELYPDLKNKIAEWKEKGVHFLGYINPFMAIEKPLYKYASEHGYCVKNKKGEDYMVTITTFPAAMIDFTNPEAYEWYKNLIKENMIGIGIASDGVISAIASVRPGAGKDIVLALCKGMTAERVCLEVAEENIKALRLYERLGFSVTSVKNIWYKIK
jgi:hypothetical protein